MKKILLFIAAGFIISNLAAQDQRFNAASVKVKNPIASQSHSRNVHVAPAAVIYSQDFGSGIPAGWAVTDSAGNGEIWTYSTGGPMGPSISPGDTIQSATAANGFMIIDDDFYGNNMTVTSTELISTAINCSANSIVRIAFTDYFRQFAAVAALYVSNDSVNWVDVYHAETGLAQNAATANPHNVDIDISATAANQTTLFIKFKYVGNWDYFWEVDDIQLYEPAATDAGVSGITAITSGCGLSATTPISISIANFGASPISGFPVSYTINGGAPVTETFTGSIPASGGANYTFTTTANLSAVGNYTIIAYTGVTGDANASNDSSSTSTANTSSIAITTGSPFTEDFETAATTTPPAGWLVEDTDGDLNKWDFPATFTHGGLVCARIGFGNPAAATTENWLFTPCLDLTSGTNYVLEFYYKTFDGTATAYQLETRLGTSSVSTAMTLPIAVEPVPTDSSYHYVAHTFSVPSNGTYYLGFNGFGSGVTASTRVDDMQISIATGVKEVTNPDNLLVSPNPTNGFLNISGKVTEDNMQLVINNYLGQPVYSQKYSAAFKTQVDLSTFASGIYTVQLITSKGVITKRITLQTK